MVAEGDWVGVRLMVTGKHGAQPSIPFDSGIYNLTEPKGLPFTTQHMHMFKVVTGRSRSTGQRGTTWGRRSSSVLSSDLHRGRLRWSLPPHARASPLPNL